MRFSDIWKMCAENLKRRKGRTFLTVLGVFIGCCSIIVMVSIGIGMTESQNQMLQNMGDLTIIEVSSGTSNTGQEMKLDDAAVETFSSIDGVQAVMPKMNCDYTVNLYAGLNNRYKAEWATLVGVDTSALEAMGYEFLDGITAGGGRDEGVAGQYFAYSFKDTLLPDGSNTVDRWGEYDDQGNQTKEPDDPYFDPLKTPIILEVQLDETTSYQREMKITGIVKEDYGRGYETSEGLMVSTATLKDIIEKATGQPQTKITYSGMNVKVTDISLVADVEKSIKDMGYNTWSMSSMREELEKSSRQIQLLLGGLGAISLFVAAIGITNTMIMSISERTKEIGIMKSLGCYIRDIRALFLMEAGTIGLLGGIAGSIVSLMISWLIDIISIGQGFTWDAFKLAVFGGENITRLSIVPLWLILFAIVFSIFIGLVSGYYPANKAVKIPALEAIKSE